MVLFVLLLSSAFSNNHGRALLDRFPCGMCRLQAYCCCPCTLGLSLLSMRSQAKEIERGGCRGIFVCVCREREEDKTGT